MYPSWRYHKDGREKIVHSHEEDKALGPGWAGSPADHQKEAEQKEKPEHKDKIEHKKEEPAPAIIEKMQPEIPFDLDKKEEKPEPKIAPIKKKGK